MGYKRRRGAQMILYSSSSPVCLDDCRFHRRTYLYTGEGKLIVMTPSFDVLHESALYTDNFGEGKLGHPLVLKPGSFSFSIIL